MNRPWNHCWLRIAVSRKSSGNYWWKCSYLDGKDAVISETPSLLYGWKHERGIVLSVGTLKLIKYCLVLTMLWCSTTVCNNSNGVVVISTRVLSGSLTLGPYLLSASSTCEINALLTAMNSTACLQSGDFPCCRGDSCLLLRCKQ